MRRHALAPVALIALVACLPWRAAAQADPAPADAGWVGATNPRIDSLFAAVNAPDSPGCGIEVDREGTPVYSRGYGRASLEFALPIAPSTVYDIASVSKQFTALTVLLLVRDHLLTLDDDIRRFLPELTPTPRPIRVRDLLTQTSGLRDYVNLFPWAGVGYEAIVTPHDALTMLARQQNVDFPAGDEWEYSNSNYFLAALIVERASHQPFAMVLEERLFRPLGMTATRIMVHHEEVVPHRAQGYAQGPDTAGSRRFAVGMYNWETYGDGAINTTLADLSRWTDNYRTHRVGDSAMVAQMTQPAVLRGGQHVKYGFGLTVSQYRGLRVQWHNGGSSGYLTTVALFPDQHLGVSTACNTLTFVPFAIHQRVADILLADAFAAAPAAATPAPDSLAPGAARAIDKGPAARFRGRYFSAATGFVRDVDLRGDTLTLAAGGPPAPLAPLGDGRYRAATRATVWFEAPRGSSAVTYVETASVGGAPVRYDRLRDTVPTPAARLLEYAGQYASRDLGANWSVRAEKGALLLRLPGVGVKDDTLQADFADGFHGNVGSVRFERDAQHRVTALRAWTGGVRGLLFRRTSPATP